MADARDLKAHGPNWPILRKQLVFQGETPFRGARQSREKRRKTLLAGVATPAVSASQKVPLRPRVEYLNAVIRWRLTCVSKSSGFTVIRHVVFRHSNLTQSATTCVPLSRYAESPAIGTISRTHLSVGSTHRSLLPKRVHIDLKLPKSMQPPSRISPARCWRCASPPRIGACSSVFGRGRFRQVSPMRFPPKR